MFILPRIKFWSLGKLALLENRFCAQPLQTVPATNYSNMVDPKRVVSYEDMLKMVHQPEKVIIDVRNRDEISETGQIPSSTNIPLGEVQEALMGMSKEEFHKQYNRNKPSEGDELVFYCKSGKRATEALHKALDLGYSKSKTYLGSWSEWSSRQQ